MADDKTPYIATLLAWVATHSKELMTLAAFLVPITVGLIGLAVNQTISERSVDAQHLEIAIQILSKDEQGERAAEDRALRDFAVDLLQDSSPVQISEALEQQLRDGSTTFDTLAFAPLNTASDFTSFDQSQLLQRTINRIHAEQQALIEASADSEIVQDSSRCSATILGRSPFGGGSVLNSGTYGVEAVRDLEDGSKLLRFVTGSWLKIDAGEIGAVLSADCSL